MRLYSRIIGAGPTILVLHGLLGMSDNWLTIGQGLAAAGWCVHLLDLRNHGRSPHTDTHRYPEICDDLLEYLHRHRLPEADIIGHSMGGKAAMMFGLLEPEMVRRLVIVDIAPADYRSSGDSFNAAVINTMLEVDLEAHSSRGSVRAELTARLNDRNLAMFLTKNLRRDPATGTFVWRVNLPVLKKFIQHLHIGLEELELHAPCPAPTLFIKGNDSVYYLPEHDALREHFFEDSRVVGIDAAGHWIQSDQPKRFLQEVISFLSRP